MIHYLEIIQTKKKKKIYIYIYIYMTKQQRSKREIWVTLNV